MSEEGATSYGAIAADPARTRAPGTPEAAVLSEDSPLIPRSEEEGVPSDPGGGKEPDTGGGGGGLSVKQAALLIAGEMAGSGVLALPRALAKTGWVGVPVIILMCGIAGYGGARLGECRALLEERDPRMRRRQRNPYAIIARHAIGRHGAILVSVCIQVTLIGAGIVYLLLAAQLVEELLSTVLPGVSYCMWYLYITLLLTPAVLMGSPKDFSFMGTVAFSTTVLACVFFFIQIFNDVKPYRVFRYGLHGFEEFFLAFGTILFAFGGASTFPTIQNDMVDKRKFTESIWLAFSAILIVYLPITIGAYLVYGESVAPNFATSLTPTPALLLGNALMAVHLLCAFVIIMNPVFQEIEEYFRLPHAFCWRRLAARTGVMLGMLLVGESVPKFSGVLALVGGSSVALLTYVLPTYCCMRLRGQARERQSRPHELVVFWEIIGIGALGGLAATYSAVSAIFSAHMARPCYLR